jgi:carbamoyl-phosphate synthase large subunit
MSWFMATRVFRLPGLPVENEGKKEFLSVRESDKANLVPVAKLFADYGFKLVATSGTQKILTEAGIACERINKVTEGRPHIVDAIKNGEIAIVVNTTEGKQAIADSSMIRRTALRHDVFCTTTIASASAVCEALTFGDKLSVYTIQELHARLNTD